MFWNRSQVNWRLNWNFKDLIDAIFDHIHCPYGNLNHSIFWRLTYWWNHTFISWFVHKLPCQSNFWRSLHKSRASACQYFLVSSAPRQLFVVLVFRVRHFVWCHVQRWHNFVKKFHCRDARGSRWDPIQIVRSPLMKSNWFRYQIMYCWYLIN